MPGAKPTSRLRHQIRYESAILVPGNLKYLLVQSRERPAKQRENDLKGLG